MPFPLVVSQRYSETFIFQTEILEANSGLEQRRRLRTLPRRRFNTDSYVPFWQVEPIDRHLQRRRDKAWHVPLWKEKLAALLFRVEGSTDLSVPTTGTSFRVGGSVFVYESAEKYFARTITGITPGVVYFTEPTPFDVNVGCPIYPGEPCRLLKDPTRSVTGRYSRVRAVFEGLNTAQEVPFPTGTTPAEYNGAPLLLIPPDKAGSEGSTAMYAQRMDVLDYGTTIVWGSPWDLPKTVTPYRFLTETQDELQEVLAWFFSRAGRLKPFYMPSWEPVLFPVDNGYILSIIRVKYIPNWWELPVGTKLAIHRADGSITPCAFVGADPVLFEDDLLDITVDVIINIEPVDIKMISLLPLRRFLSDSLTLHNTGGTDVVDIPFSTVEVTQ